MEAWTPDDLQTFLAEHHIPTEIVHSKRILLLEMQYSGGRMLAQSVVQKSWPPPAIQGNDQMGYAA